MLPDLTLCLGAAVAGVMSETNSCTDIKDKIIGKRLPVPISWPRIEKNIGFQMCLRKCEAMSACLSINFNRFLFECELNDRKKQNLNELTDDDNYMYAETTVSRINTELFENAFFLIKNMNLITKIFKEPVYSKTIILVRLKVQH